MKWRQGRRSTNIEDRRGRRTARGARAGGVGIVGLLIMMGIAWVLGINPLEVLRVADVSAPSASLDPGPSVHDPNDELAQFVSVVLADTEDTWNEIFARQGQDYREPILVLFTDRVRSACGLASAASGPFYCPADHKVYIDLAFYRELRDRFRAPGDFAQAYVIAHEIGHHVQSLTGISREVHEQEQRLPKAEANALSVRLELQADCFAGIWAHHAQRSRQVLEQGDLEEALNAAAAIGDDRIQKQSRGYVVPDAFTHGTSEQRVRWFRVGFESGDPNACDTFSIRNP
jgi:predicted metalloprotease